MHDGVQHQALRIYQEMALFVFDLLYSAEPMGINADPLLWNGPPHSSIIEEGDMKDVWILGVDLGKNRLQRGRAMLRRQMRRDGVVALAAKLPGCVVAMEACCGAHLLGRLLAARGGAA